MRAQSDENTTPAAPPAPDDADATLSTPDAAAETPGDLDETPADAAEPDEDEASDEADAEDDAEDDAEADEDDATAEDEDDGEEPERAPAVWARAWERVAVRPLMSAAVALVVVAAGCAVWSGGSWYDAAHDENLRYSAIRDSALIAGEQAVQNVNTLDYRHVDQGLNLWLQSSAGDLRASIVAGRKTFATQVRQAKTATTAKVLDAAITQLDEHAGKAAIIVALEITVTPAKGKPATKRSRLQGELTRTPSGWKLSRIGQVAVDTGAGGAPLTTPTPSAS